MCASLTDILERILARKIARVGQVGGQVVVSGSDKRAALQQLTASYSCGKLNDTPTFSRRSSRGCRRGSRCRCSCPCPCRRRGIAGIPSDRHGHGHRHGHRADFRARIVARMSACLATSPFSLPRAGHARRSSPTFPPTCPTRALFLARILARMSVRNARACTRVTVYCIR